MKMFIGSGIDVYAYVTLTTPTTEQLENRIRKFVDKIQFIHPNLPLRTIPLEIEVFTPVKQRLDETNNQALKNQQRAMQCWMEELAKRYPVKMLRTSIADIELKPRN